MEQEFPRFSDREMGRRWRAADELLRTHDLDLVVAYEANRSGSAVQWFSSWQVTREALLLMGLNRSCLCSSTTTFRRPDGS
ncbi:MAG: hypothetical protein GEU79_13995 [Acidimicrobiia bacterium]|nr:hypothetical protein [Acidimicrobiia bacterium]